MAEFMAAIMGNFWKAWRISLSLSCWVSAALSCQEFARFEIAKGLLSEVKQAYLQPE